MKKILYLTPAVVVCLFYGLMAILVGGIGGFQPIALLYMGLPVISSVLLVKGKWRGGYVGMVMGLVLMGRCLNDGNTVLLVFGIALAVYYAAMAVLCRNSLKN